jgi:hypothetical protein
MEAACGLNSLVLLLGICHDFHQLLKASRGRYNAFKRDIAKVVCDGDFLFVSRLDFSEVSLYKRGWDALVRGLKSTTDTHKGLLYLFVSRASR